MSDYGVGQACWKRWPRALSGRQSRVLDAGTLGFMLLPRVEHVRPLLVLDAASVGGAHGELRISKARTSMRRAAAPLAAVHELGLTRTCRRSTADGRISRRGAPGRVQPERLDWGTTMSRPSRRRCPPAS